jgi:hypothetical protein
MEHESFGHVEHRLAGMQLCGAPGELRAVTLAKVHCELRAARWDLRMARVAAALLTVGIGLNMAIGYQSAGFLERPSQGIARVNSQQSFLDVAVLVAQATDAATGSQIARQLAARSGLELTDAEAAAIDAAAKTATSHANSNGSKG